MPPSQSALFQRIWDGLQLSPPAQTAVEDRPRLLQEMLQILKDRESSVSDWPDFLFRLALTLSNGAGHPLCDHFLTSGATLHGSPYPDVSFPLLLYVLPSLFSIFYDTLLASSILLFICLRLLLPLCV